MVNACAEHSRNPWSCVLSWVGLKEPSNRHVNDGPLDKNAVVDEVINIKLSESSALKMR